MAGAEPTAHGKSEMVCAFLLEPDVPCVIVGQFHDEHPGVFGQRGRNLLDQLLLTLNIDRREEFILVNRTEQFLVLDLALLLRIGERRHMPEISLLLELHGAAGREFQKFL